MFFSFPCTKDPLWSQKYPGKSTAVCVAEAPWQWFAPFADKRVRHRGADYEELKKELTAKLLAVMFMYHPHLKDKVVYTELGTPVSTQYDAAM